MEWNGTKHELEGPGLKLSLQYPTRNNLDLNLIIPRAFLKA